MSDSASRINRSGSTKQLQTDSIAVTNRSNGTSNQTFAAIMAKAQKENSPVGEPPQDIEVTSNVFLNGPFYGSTSDLTNSSNLEKINADQALKVYRSNMASISVENIEMTIPSTDQTCNPLEQSSLGNTPEQNYESFVKQRDKDPMYKCKKCKLTLQLHQLINERCQICNGIVDIQ